MNESSYPFVVGPTRLTLGDITQIVGGVMGLPVDSVCPTELAEGYWLIEAGKWPVQDWRLLDEYLNHGQFHSDRYSLEIPLDESEVAAFQRAIKHHGLEKVVVGFPECRNDTMWVVKGDRRQVGTLYVQMRQPIRLP